MGPSKLKTVFQSYKRPEGHGRWKLALTGMLGIVTLGGLGIGAYHVVNDSSESLSSSRDLFREPQTYTPPVQAPVEKKAFSFTDLNPLAKEKPKAKKKSFAEKKRLSKKKKLAKKHKKHKKSKIAKNKKKHKKTKLAKKGHKKKSSAKKVAYTEI